MREDWIECSLIEGCDIHDNLRKPINSRERNDRINGKSEDQLFPYYGATGQVGFIDDYLTNGNYVLIGEDAAPFLDYSKDVAYKISGKTWVNNHAHILKSKFNDSFLLHYLNNFNYKNYVSGTTRLKLTQGRLKQIPIKIAPLPEQRAIVSKIEELFSDLDKGVADLKKAQDQLKIYRQAVLKKAFEGKLINVYMVVKKLSDVCEIVMGQSPPGSSYNQEGIGTPLINGPVEFGEGPLGKTVKSKWTTKPTKLCKKGDLILCVRGSTTGKTNIANFEACVGRGVAAIRYNSNQEYLNSYMLFKRYEIFAKGTGTTFPSMSSKELREFDFPVCSQEEQLRIVQEIESRLSVCDKVEESITESLEKAEALRQSILKKAFDGNLLSIQEIEKCKTAPDYEPAVVLLEKIKSEIKK